MDGIFDHLRFVANALAKIDGRLASDPGKEDAARAALSLKFSARSVAPSHPCPPSPEAIAKNDLDRQIELKLARAAEKISTAL